MDKIAWEQIVCGLKEFGQKSFGQKRIELSCPLTKMFLKKHLTECYTGQSIIGQIHVGQKYFGQARHIGQNYFGRRVVLPLFNPQLTSI